MNEDILYKYVTGQADELEKREVDRLSLQSEEFKNELNRLQNIWVLSGVSNKIDDELIQTGIAEILAKISQIQNQKRRRNLKLSAWQYAAALVITIFISGAVGYYASWKFSGGATGQITKVVVDRGERSTVVLPDGSEVKINSGSTLSFPVSFNGSRRVVSFTGEAFFRVKKDKRHPFIVESGKLTVEVLGTQFNFRNYGDEWLSATYLQSGRVKLVFDGQDDIYMLPSEFVKVDKQGHYEKIKVKDDYYTDWTRGIFTVRGETIESLAKRLERLFDVQVYFADEDVRKHTYTGSINDDNLKNILEAIHYASSLKYKWNEEERKVTFYSR